MEANVKERIAFFLMIPFLLCAGLFLIVMLLPFYIDFNPLETMHLLIQVIGILGILFFIGLGLLFYGGQ